MKKITFLFFTFVTLAMGNQAKSQIVINELVSSNSTINVDEDNSYQDWVELYNNGPAAVNLTGYGLTDDATLPYKWVFPNVTVASGAYLLVYCSDKNRTTPGLPLHTNWKIGSDGEAITLTAPGNITVDVAPAMAFPQNSSWGRLPNGTGGFIIFGTPTPNDQNIGTISGGELPAPVFSQNSGFFTSGFALTLSTTEPGATILYTLDGSEPSAANLGGTTYNYKNIYPQAPGNPFGPMLFNTFQTLTYAAPLTIVDRTPQPNKISNISSTYDANPEYFPNSTIYKTNVVRAKVVKAGFTDSKIVTKNYFVSPQGSGLYTIPVLSISIDENKLFDYEDGIYVAGKMFDDYRTANPTTSISWPVGNYTQKGSGFERIANFNYFVNGSEVLNQQVGIRVQGNYSRKYPCKSLNFYARAELGESKFNYKFFNDLDDNSFTRFCLKNNGSDMFNTGFRDPLVNMLTRSMHTQTEAYQPVVAFVNGEFWGMVAMREKYDDKFFNRTYGIPDNEIQLLENDGYQIEEGDDNLHYLAMFNFVKNNSMLDPANYTYLQTQMDPESFIDYFISNIYLNNRDWPGNNIVFWRRNVAYNPSAPYGSDGRWRWAVHDVTSTLDDVTDNTLEIATAVGNTEWPNPDWSTLLLRKLLENPEFKAQFITRFADIMNTNYLTSRVLTMINDMKAVLAPDMPDQMHRWKGPVDNGDWNYHINEEIQFAVQRPAIQRTQIRDKFTIANNINVNVNVSNPAHGMVKVNTIDIAFGTPGISANPYPWTGIYFSDIPVKLQAVAKPGYAFSHWTGASAETTAEITISSAASFAVTAVFIPSGFSIETSVPVYFWMMNSTIPNDTPLSTLNSTYEVPADASINFQSSFAGYPFTAADPNWRKGSMERRNKPTPLNYRPEANGGAAYVANDVKGLQITQPFQIGSLENTMVFNLSTVNYKDIKFSYAVIDEGAATGISIDYSVNQGAPVWITTGLAATSLPLTAVYQLLETDFTAIATANNNPNFKVRLRFTGPNMTASAGARVTFNNIALDGVRLPLTYPSPNSFPIGTAITNLTPTVTAAVTSYSISPGLPSGLVFNTTTGVISGTPDAITPTATYTVTATNSGGTTSYDVVITISDVAPSALSYNTPNVFTVNAPIAVLNPTVTSGTALTYSVVPALPNGLTLDTTTGIISGTPTAITTNATYTVTATNSGGNTGFGIEIRVDDMTPSALSYNTPNVFTVGSAISALNPTISGGTVLSYTVDPALPNGLTLNATTGIISGTPTAITANATYTVTATNSGGNTTFGIEIRVDDVTPSALSYNTPNVFTVDTAITSLSPSISGGTVLSYSVAPALPNGLTLDATTGIISGTPTAIYANATYTVTATNSGGNATFGVEIEVNDIALSGLSYNTPNVFTVDTAITALNPSISGGTATDYSVSPALPNGLTLDATTGVISGTPTAITANATYTVTATNSGGNTTFGIEIRVDDVTPSALSYNTPNVFTVDTAISSLSPTVSGGTVTNYSVAPALPNGLTLDALTGIISGTPTAIYANATYTVTATNSGGNATFGVEIEVNDIALSGLSYNTPNVFTVDTAITALNPSISGGTVANYSVAPALPNGLTLDATTGIISGTPTAIRTNATYTVTATNSGGNTTFGVEIRVDDVTPSALSYNTPNVFTVDTAIASLSPTVSGGTVTNYSVNPALPNGLTLDATTGIISGTPIAIYANATYTVTATNSGGNTTFGIEIRVDDVTPSVLSYNTPNVFTVDTAITALNPTVSGGTVINYSVAPALPNGLTLDALTGIISGTPTAITANATYTVTATNSGGNTGFGIEIRVDDLTPSALSYNSPNVFTVGSTIAALNPTISGGTVTNYSVVPALPNGLTLDTTTGIISGTPTIITANATYTVTATNSGGNTTFGIEIRVDDVMPSALSYNTPNVFTVGSTIAVLNPTVSGGTVLSYVVDPALPNGLTLDASTGIISGTPTAISANAIYTVTATNSGGYTTFGVEIRVDDVTPSALSYNTPNVFTIDTAISALNPTISGGTVLSYSVSPTLPNGLTLDASTGIISGTPTIITANATYTVTATNSGGNTTFGVEIRVDDVTPSALSYNTPNVFTVGSTIAALNPTISGGTVTNYSVAPALPNGLTLDASTGIISGTPTTISANATYTVTATNSGGNTTFGIEIRVDDVTPSALSYNTPNVFTVGLAIGALNPTISGGTVLSYAVDPALPNGLTLDATTGVISGTPTEVTTALTYTVTATNSGGNTTFGIAITVNPVAPAGLSYDSPNIFTVGNAIADLTPTVIGDVVIFSISPALPNGLSLDPETGIISGTPTTIMPINGYLITATNAGGNAAAAIFITIIDAAPATLAYNTPNVFTVGSTITALNPTISGGTVTNYSVAPALPNGLTLDASTGIISGTPTAISTNSTYTVTATNSGGNTTFGIEIRVDDVVPSALSYNTPNVFTVGSTITALNPTISGGTVINYSVVPALPNGLTLDATTGIISGTPTIITANATYTVTAINSGGNATFGIEIRVDDVVPSALSYNTPNVFTVGSAISVLNPTISGGTVINYSVDPALPIGLTLNTTTGIISGTPTTITANATYTVTATNSGGNTTFGIEIRVDDVTPLALSYNTPNVFTVDSAITALSPSISGGTVTNYSVAPALPNGLTLDATTGIISGTPTTITATAIYTVTALNSGGSVTFDVMITVNAVAPSALSYTSPNVFTIGAIINPLTPTILGSGITYSVSPSLPTGLGINPTSGNIFGTPTEITGIAAYTVTATNSGGSTSFDVIITVNAIAPISLIYNTPNLFTVGTTITPLEPTVGGGGVISYSVSPNLPAGLTLDSATGIISGTPTDETALAPYTVTATNSGGSVTFDVVITVQVPLGVEEYGYNFQIYPNPFDDIINIGGLTEAVDYKMYAVDGKLVQSGSVLSSQISFRELPNGMYILQLYSGNQSTIKKIIKK